MNDPSHAYQTMAGARREDKEFSGWVQHRRQMSTARGEIIELENTVNGSTILSSKSSSATSAI
jgi:hypothetical protein